MERGLGIRQGLRNGENLEGRDGVNWTRNVFTKFRRDGGGQERGCRSECGVKGFTSDCSA